MPYRCAFCGEPAANEFAACCGEVGHIEQVPEEPTPEPAAVNAARLIGRILEFAASNAKPMAFRDLHDLHGQLLAYARAVRYHAHLRAESLETHWAKLAEAEELLRDLHDGERLAGGVPC